MAQNVRNICQIAPKPRTGRKLGHMAKIRIPRAPSPPATPHFLWETSLRIAQRDAYTTIPLVTWGQHGPRTVGANGGTTRVAGERKMILSEVDPGQLGMLRVGNLKKWGVCWWTTCPRNLVLSHVPQDTARSWFWVSLTPMACNLGHFWPFWAVSRTHCGVRGQERAPCHGAIMLDVECSGRFPSFGRFE